MAMGKREREDQPPLWVTHENLPRSEGHPFYNALNRVLAHCGFDAWIEETCRPFYHQRMGRPGLAPGVYPRGSAACWWATSRASTRNEGSPGGAPTR